MNHTEDKKKKHSPCRPIHKGYFEPPMRITICSETCTRHCPKICCECCECFECRPKPCHHKDCGHKDWD